MSVGALRLALFDVDGTLVDSQAHILSAMAAGFAAVGLALPERSKILSIVGLSLPTAIAELAPHAAADEQHQIVEAYKVSYMTARTDFDDAAAPLYPHARDVLDALHAQATTLLGVATGNSGRGLARVLDAHDLHGHFVTKQVADHHPSKPHPAMALAALAEAGCAPENAVMIGDTTFDMQMGRDAGLKTIGVTWGYHTADALAEFADVVVDDFRAVPDALTSLWEQ